jgi:putative transposase
MARRPRIAVGGVVYHVLNRASARSPIFRARRDAEVFERLLVAAHEHVAMRLLDYCLMPNHWHLVLWPVGDGDLSLFLKWLTATHTQRWHDAHDTVGTGHLYQGRFKSFPVESDRHFMAVCRYVERNPVRAGLVERAEDWRWGSLWHRQNRSGAPLSKLLHAWPVEPPQDWLAFVNNLEPANELTRIRRSVARNLPLGGDSWVRRMASRLGLSPKPRRRGRPREKKSKCEKSRL